MATISLESHKADILTKLRDAKDKGLNKSQLKITTKASKLRLEAFNALEKEGKIRNMGTPKKVRYVLPDFYRALELAYEKIETYLLENQKPNKIKLISKTKLAEQLPAGSIRSHVDEAIKLLLSENKLLKLKHGNGTYFLHAHPVLEMFSFAQVSPEKKEVPPLLDLTREQVLEAYQKVKQRIGFSNVEIYELQQELGVPMEQLKAFIVEEGQAGKAVLTRGEWSISSEETRSGAIEVRGEPYLMVRFKA